MSILDGNVGDTGAGGTGLNLESLNVKEISRDLNGHDVFDNSAANK